MFDDYPLWPHTTLQKTLSAPSFSKPAQPSTDQPKMPRRVQKKLLSTRLVHQKLITDYFKKSDDQPKIIQPKTYKKKHPDYSITVTKIKKRQ